MERKRMAYISGALTDMSEEQRQGLRAFYESLGEICAEYGFEPYIPHIYGDPKRTAHLSPKEIDRIDRQAVTQSFFTVAYVGVPSTGVGIEIEAAYHAARPVILLYEKRKLKERLISRLVRGNPAVVEQIAFEDFEDARRKFRAFLPRFADIANFLDVEGSSLPDPLRIAPCRRSN